jgi:hypothetical protein
VCPLVQPHRPLTDVEKIEGTTGVSLAVWVNISSYNNGSEGEVGLYKGTHEKVKAKDVKKARVVGSGCFKIFKNRGHKGAAFLVKGSGTLELSEHGHTWTTVK